MTEHAPAKVGFAVVGLGNISKGAILPAFANSKEAKLVALVSRDKIKAGRMAEQFGAGVSYSNEEFAMCVADPNVHAVYIATPPGEHLPFAVQAAKNKKHVLCEKPLAATASQSAQMVQACRSHGVLLMTAYRKYYEPSTVYLKQLLRQGALGRLDMIHTSFSEVYVPGTSPAWMMDASLAGGGPLMDLGVYCVNTSRWLAGEDPLEAMASSWSHGKIFREVEEGITFRLRFPSGLLLQGSSTYSAALSSFLLIQGKQGWLSLTPAFPFDEERRLTGKIGGQWIEKSFPPLDEFALELDAFAAAIRGGGTIEPDGLQGHRDMVIFKAIYEAAKTNRPVAIRY
jgi:predicted dehydrogenase